VNKYWLKEGELKLHLNDGSGFSQNSPINQDTAIRLILIT
jgi:hypothetical protein